jgi:hypothetical protein
MKDFWYEHGEAITAIVVIALVVVLAWFGSGKFMQASCDAKTKDIGFAHRWSTMGGCQIEVDAGRWIPLDSYYFKQE